MDLLEYQGKQLFRKHGVSVPEGKPAGTVEQAVAAAEELGYPVVVKAQVQIGGRGKAGGIKLANDRAEAEQHAEAILGMDIRGFTVHEIYVEKASEIDEEYYAAIAFDRSAKKPMAMLSRMGGMDVEEVAEKDPEAMRMLHVDPLSASKTSTGAGSPSSRGSRRTRSAQWARCSDSSTTCSCARTPPS